MVPLSLFATARRHWTWLRSASERPSHFVSDLASSLGSPVCTGPNKMKGLAPHPWTGSAHWPVTQARVGVRMRVRGEASPPPLPP